MKRFCFFAILFGLFVALWVPLAQATLVTLTDLNTIVRIDTQSPLGMQDWVVDDVENLYQQWFWYRIGETAESSIDSLYKLDEEYTSTYLRVEYGDAATEDSSTFTLQITYTLTGATSGSRTSMMEEGIRIINKTGSSLDFHLFQYTDFDLWGDAVGDYVYWYDDHSFMQYDNGLVFTETTGNPIPDHYEAADWSDTLDKLNDGAASNLNDNPTAGPGDVTFSWQWDQSISGGGTFLISKEKRITPPIPEPGTLLLLGSGLVGFAGYARIRTRRRKRDSV